MKNDDAALIQRVLDGDDTAFASLVRKYQKSVHALAWRKIGDFHIAEDITQETFLKAYQNLSTLKEPQRFASWLYVIAANHCSTWLRKKRLSTQSLESTSSGDLEKSTYSGYVIAENERVAMEEQREVVKKLLAKLQESDRTVITLHYLGGMTYKEISEFLGVSVGAVKNRVYRAQQRLKREEAMIREALENFQITPNLTENIMREISRLKSAAPSGGKPLVPWAIGISVVTIVLLMIGFSNQQLSRFQKPYSFNAASEMKVELIDAPIVRNLETEPDDRTQLGNANAQGENNRTDEQANNAAPLDLETLITRIKHHHNAVTSVTGDFVMESPGAQIEKDEYSLTLKGEKVRIEWKKRDAVNLPLVEYWDGKQQWEVYRPNNLLFGVEVAPDKESTAIEKVQQGFKRVGIEIADDARIVPGEFSDSFRIIAEDKTYFARLVGETKLEVYDGNVRYSIRQSILSQYLDPRFWLTFPSPASDHSYLSQPLWQLLEKHESELIGSELLNGEMTSVIRVNIIPNRTNWSLKLWISHNIGFRPVKLESTHTHEGVTYINTREIEYHEYLTNVWFPKRIETSSRVPVKLLEQQGVKPPILHVLLTKQCRLNTDVSESLRLDISLDTPVFDSEVAHERTVEDLEFKPDIQSQPSNTDVPSENSKSEAEVNNAPLQDSLQWHLPEGAKARLGKGLTRHIAYSSDGTLLAVASSIGIWLHDAQTGREVDLLTEHTASVRSVAFSPDGSTLASGNRDNTIRLWDMQTRTLRKTLTGHTGTVLNVVFSADGKTLASASADSTIRLWNMETDTLRQTLTGHTDRVLSVAFSADGRILASASEDNTIRLWDTQSGGLHKTLLLEHPEEILEMAFSPDGKILATQCWDSPIFLWDVQTGERRKTLPGESRDAVNSIAFSADGKILASAMENDIIRLWNIQTGELSRILIGHTYHVFCVAFSPDGKILASGSYDGTLRLWDAKTGKIRNTYTGYTSEVVNVAFSADGKTLAGAMGNDTVGLWDAQTGTPRRTLKVQPRTHTLKSVTFSPDGKVLAGGGYGSVVHLWHAETGEHQNTLGGQHKEPVASVAFSVDGTALASASWDKTVQLWDTQTGELRNTLSGHTDWVNSVAFSPDGTTLASASNDMTIRLWDAQTGELHRTFTGHQDVVNSVAFSPDGKVLASGSGDIYERNVSGSQDKTIRLWDVETGTIRRMLPAQKNKVLCVAFSPDGKVLAASQDKIIQLWDMQTHTVRRTLEGHTGRVWNVAFSPDGRTLVSGSGDGTLLLWELTPHTAD